MKIHETFPYLRVKGAREAIEFYKSVFEVTEKFRLVEPGTDRIGHSIEEVTPEEMQRRYDQMV